MMHRSRRGAARVPVIWIVVVLVAFFAALGLMFASSSDASKAWEQADAAREEARRAEQLLIAEREALREVSAVAGYYDRNAASARAQAEPLGAGLERFKESFGTVMGPDVKDFETALERATASYRALAARTTELEKKVAELTTEVQQKTAAMAQLSSTKDQQIADLRQQLSDAEQSARARQDELEQEIAAIRSTLGDTETSLTAARADLEQQARKAADRELEMSTRFKEMSTKLAFLREPETPDGQVLAVSKDLGLGWIDLGKRNRLFAGMSFNIVAGTPGSERIKGFAEVREVRDDMAEVLITGITDKFDPPVPGDLVYNPLYDPVGGRNAVLLGRFSGSYNESELRALLVEIGVNVQERVDKTTDYLIVGSEMYSDAEGEPLEEPMQPSDTAAYKEAEAMGVQIVPLKQVRDFFRRTSL